MPKIISVFGGSAPRPGSPPYEEARELGAQLARAGWAVATGGYSGVMEAASRGAAEAEGRVIGVTCGFFQDWMEGLQPNAWVKEEIKFGTLRERLYHLVNICDAAIALSGGIGTLSEISFMWSMLQVGEIKRKPLVLVGLVWRETFSTFIHSADGYIRRGDHDLLRLVDTVDEAVQAVNH